MDKITFEQAVSIALEQHQAGNFARAEQLYLEILRQDPGNVDAMHLLGVLARQGKKPEIAVKLITAAIGKKPDAPIFHYNLADAYYTLDRKRESVEEYRLAAKLDPRFLGARNNLASVLNELKEFAEAETVSREALGLDPKNAIALDNLGTALRGRHKSTEALAAHEAAVASDPNFVRGITNLAMCLCFLNRLDEGIEQFKRAIALQPAAADAHNNLGTAYSHQGKLELAGRCFQTAIDLQPNHAAAINNLGSALRGLGKLDDAVTQYRKAIELKPDFVEAQVNLAVALSDLLRKDEALDAIDVVLQTRPTLVQALFLRSIILRDMHRLDEGVDCLRKTLGIEPEFVPALTAMGYALLERGENDEAMAVLQRSIELKPDPQTHSNVLMTMNYHPGFSPQQLLEAHQGWATLHEAPNAGLRRAHTNDRSPDRRLRIGYISPDFRGHSVSYFLAPILDHHDHAQFEIYGYANVTSVDMNTWRMRAQIDLWRETVGKTALEVAEQIRADEIDILVDLAGHTANNSLVSFGRKPAPVQINMIGFPSTTGLASMDYRITDARCDPPGITDAFNTEKLIRLPEIFWTFLPPHHAPEVGPLPADSRDGVVTFASVNNFTKVTSQVQSLWAKLLRAVPKSRLILQANALSSSHTRKLVAERFAADGVAADRIELRSAIAFPEFLKFLNSECDITLDPFPFNGGTTTCQSLWMGVPVLTLAGDRHAARMGLSMMSAIGLGEWVANSPVEFVEIGARICADLARLREIRAGMRERLNASPLLDHAGYTRNLERAYREVWGRWCASGS